MIHADRLSLAFDLEEDRILVTAEGPGEAVRLLLTRRITQNLLRGFADVLLRTSPAVQRAPADLRVDVIVLEHEGALTGSPRPRTSAQSNARLSPAVDARQLPPLLATRVDVDVTPTRFIITVHDRTAPRVVATADRGGFHRLLAALDRRAEQAAWNIRAGAGWLPRSGRALIDRLGH